MRIGILGGAFDPIHFGHLRSAEEVYESLSLDKVLFIPTASPPHKTGRPLTDFPHRLKMTGLAVHSTTHFEISEIEGNIPGHSYSVETLRRLQDIYKNQGQFYFIAGLDAFCELPTWKEYKVLPSYTNFVVVSRPGYHQPELRCLLDKHFPGYTYDQSREEYSLPGQLSIFYRKVTPLQISSTMIRCLAAKGRSTRFLLPSSVEDYIHSMRLYGKQRQDCNGC